MSKILKNNTASAVVIDDTGVTVPASGQYTISPVDYPIFAASSDVITSVSDVPNPTLTVNDGSNDLSISDGVDLIKGIFPNSVTIEGVNNTNGAMDVNANITVSPFTVNNTFRVDWSDTKIDLNKKSTGYTDVYSYSGSGSLYSFKMQFNSKDIEVKLVIDGITIFEIPCEMLEDLFHNNKGVGVLFFLKWEKEKDVLSFEPKHPMLFGTNVAVSAQADSNSNSKDMKRYIINIDKES